MSAEEPLDAAALRARHAAVLPSWLTLYYAEPIELVRGEGVHVWDSAGRRYLDFFGGILTTISGHNLPELTRVLTDQAERLNHSSTLYLIRSMVELAERLVELAPVDPPAKAFFTTSGSEANEAALLFATSLRRSNEIIALRNSYHGRSFAAHQLDRLGVVQRQPARQHRGVPGPQRRRVGLLGAHGSSSVISP